MTFVTFTLQTIDLDELAELFKTREVFRLFCCGSVCKDWSTMGNQKGFNGTYVLLCAIMFALVERVKPKALLHECTERFPADIFEQVLNEYTDNHTIMQCANFGAPVKRTRAYDFVVHKSFELQNGLNDLGKLSSKCFLDSSIWLQSSDAEAQSYVLMNCDTDTD